MLLEGSRKVNYLPLLIHSWNLYHPKNPKGSAGCNTIIYMSTTTSTNLSVQVNRPTTYFETSFTLWNLAVFRVEDLTAEQISQLLDEGIPYFRKFQKVLGNNMLLMDKFITELQDRERSFINQIEMHY